MLLTLIGRELRSHLLTYRFGLSASLLFILIVGSALVLGVNYERRLEAFTESQLAREQKMAEATDFRTLAWQGSEHERPPNPLSVFTVGLERELSRSVTIAARSEPSLGQSKFSSPLFRLFPAPDFLYIVNIVGSLLAILFAFNAISGDHEDGTLRLVMSNAVPRHLVLLAKWIGGYTALMLPLLGSTLIGLLLVTTLTPFSLSGYLGPFIGMLVIAAMYLSLFFTLGLAVSVLTRRSGTSLVICFLVWVVWVLAVPNVAPIVARAIVPIPSAGAMANERAAIRRAAWDGMRGRWRRDMSRDERDAMREEAEEKMASETEALMDDFSRRLQAQVNAGMTLARLSPSASYVYATASLAGSGLGDFSELRGYIERYRESYLGALEQIEQDRRRQTEGIEDRDEREQIMEAPIELDDLPVFDPPKAPVSEIVSDGQADILLLAVLNGVFFLVAYVRFLRYDLAS